MKQKRPAFIMFLLSILFTFTAAGAFAGKGPARSFGLPVKWGELTAPDFIKAVERSAGLCLIPIGVFEKPGPHLPLGTGLIDVREIALRAARKEYALCLPGILFQPDIGSKTPARNNCIQP